LAGALWSSLFKRVQRRVDVLQQALNLVALFRSDLFLQPLNELLLLRKQFAESVHLYPHPCAIAGAPAAPPRKCGPGGSRSRTHENNAARGAELVADSNLAQSPTRPAPFITKRNGFIVSEPGRSEVRIKCLPGSALPAIYEVSGKPQSEDGGESVLAGAIVEKFVTGNNGEPEPLTAGSTRPVAQVRRGCRQIQDRKIRFRPA
jgi:hypothetical protein